MKNYNKYLKNDIKIDYLSYLATIIAQFECFVVRKT